MSLGSSLSYELSSSSRPELVARVQVQDLDLNSTRCHASPLWVKKGTSDSHGLGRMG